MKRILIFFLTVYHIFISPLVHALVGGGSGCRYSPTCSVYTKQVIEEKGVIKGVPLALKRILSCQPFAKIV
ncbi:MAG TPA: membrane protein insertion efficiency factor YidD [Patescibacteria group bacterium]|nr:membrane protein insertion efficiency factor YidD [Patescibacteria group bacterium]